MSATLPANIKVPEQRTVTMESLQSICSIVSGPIPLQCLRIDESLEEKGRSVYFPPRDKKCTLHSGLSNQIHRRTQNSRLSPTYSFYTGSFLGSKIYLYQIWNSDSKSILSNCKYILKSLSKKIHIWSDCKKYYVDIVIRIGSCWLCHSSQKNIPNEGRLWKIS